MYNENVFKVGICSETWKAKVGRTGKAGKSVEGLAV